MKKANGPRVLIWDIETAGVQGLCADRGFVVCFGWKFVGDPKTHCITVKDYPGKTIHDDSKLLAAALDILEEADSLVAHYGEKFDRPYVEARLIKAGLPPIPNTRQIDTCLIARRKFKLSSNRLGNLAEFLEVPVKKMDKRGGWPLWWMEALRGDAKSIAKMAVYCKQDVDCLEGIYLKMRHVIPGKYLLNYAMGCGLIWTCPGCGGKQKQDRGVYWSEMTLYQRHQCKACGRWSRSRKAINKA